MAGVACSRVNSDLLNCNDWKELRRMNLKNLFEKVNLKCRFEKEKTIKSEKRKSVKSVRVEKQANGR